MNKPSVTILIAYRPDGGEWDGLAAITLPRWRAYASRHGLRFDSFAGTLGNAERHYPWQKTAWVAERIATIASDFAWVLDLDTMPTNPAIDVRGVLDDEHDLFIGEDVNGINAGSYLLRRGERSRQWCFDVLSFEGKATSENHAMMLLDERPAATIPTKRVAGINSIPYDLYPAIGRQPHPSQWEPRHLLMHLPGMTPAERVRMFSEAIAG